MKAFSADRDDVSVCDFQLIRALCRNPQQCSTISLSNHEQSSSLQWQWESTLPTMSVVSRKSAWRKTWQSRRRKARYFNKALAGGCQLVHRPRFILYLQFFAPLTFDEDEVDISSFRSLAAARSADLASASRLSLRRSAKSTSCNQHIFSTQAFISVVAIVGLTATNCSSMTCGKRASTICSSMLC